MNTPYARVLLALPFAALAVAAAPELLQDDVEIITTSVAGGVHLLEGRGGNIGVLVGADGVLMVDDQFAPLAPKLQAAIDALSRTNSKPRFLVNTHHHGDHTGGNAIFGADATVLAHDNVRVRLETAARAKPELTPGLPVVTYADSATVHFDGETVRLVHYEHCHTDGDTVVYFESANVVHMGDLFFNGRFPFVDLDSGGSTLGLERAVGAILAELPDDVKLIPGHGALATKAELARYHAMLSDTIAILSTAAANGDDAKSVLAKGLLAKYDDFGGGFISTERYATTVLAELSRATERR